MNYYVDIHANILPGMPALAGGTLTPEQAAERLAFFHRSNIKTAAAAPFFDGASQAIHVPADEVQQVVRG